MTQVRRNFFRPPAGPLYNATAAALRKTNGQEASTVLDTSMMCWKRLRERAGGRWRPLGWRAFRRLVEN
jgi:hypothetical protein